MTVNECIKFVESHMEVKYATKNRAYKNNNHIKNIEGCVNHSVGCAQPSIDVFFNTMNKETATWGVNAILGDFHKGEGRILVTLPLDVKPGGCGSGKNGSWNNTKIQWEVCEPSGHTYSGGTMVGYNVEKNNLYFERMWNMLVAWNVYCCVKIGYPVSGISDHSEAYKAGYGTNHSDMSQWLPRHKKSMKMLREEVQKILDAEKEEKKIERVEAEIISEPAFQVRVSINNLNIRKGPGTNYPTTGKFTGVGVFTIVETSEGKGSSAGWGKLKSGAGWISLVFAKKI